MARLIRYPKPDELQAENAERFSVHLSNLLEAAFAIEHWLLAQAFKIEINARNL